MDIQKFIEEVKSMTVVELNEFVKALEEEFGVSAAAPVAVAGAGAAEAAPAEEEKTEFNIVLKDFGANKIGVIKVVREFTGKVSASSRKACRRQMQRLQLPSSRKQALPPSSSNRTRIKSSRIRVSFFRALQGAWGRVLHFGSPEKAKAFQGSWRRGRLRGSEGGQNPSAPLERTQREISKNGAENVGIMALLHGKSPQYTRFSRVIRGNYLTKRHFHDKIKRKHLETLL